MPKLGFIPPKPRRAAELIEYLETAIVTGELVTGNRVPSLRDLQLKFDLSYSTVQRAVAYLCARGLLAKAGQQILIGNRSGAANPARRAVRKILVVIHSARMAQRAGLYLTALQGIRAAALEHDCLLDVMPVGWDVSTRELQQAIDRVDGVILLLESDNLRDVLPVALPVVGVQTVTDFGGRISLIDIDPLNAAEQAVAHFLERKLRKSKIYIARFPSYQIRADAFRNRWVAAGLPEPEMIHHNKMDEIFELEFAADTAHYFTSDSMLEVYCMDYSRRFPGRSLPDDASVLGIDGKRLINPDFHRFPTIAVNWLEIGRTAFEECNSLIESPGRPRRRIWIPGSLVLNGELEGKSPADA
ncbi:MAG: substrate-binding domain-containing protein [Victivallaceae bacterium]